MEMHDDLPPTAMLHTPLHLEAFGRPTAQAGSSVRSRDAGRFDGFPKVGDTLEGCRLVAELGRGATGVVFLAREQDLADRPLVLKVTTDAARGEHLAMAQLQHTHVMPLYWTAELRREGLHVLAMPYLGRTTLARLLLLAGRSAGAQRLGKRIASLLEADEGKLDAPLAQDEHHAEELRASTWPEFVVRMGRILAETLWFLHRRNFVHLDIKPSNVLFTPDGQPILLDLDIACQPVREGETALPWLGGTAAYMSPEQARAIAALERGEPMPCAVDGRSDLYSLAVVLCEALDAARHGDGTLDSGRWTKSLPLGLRDILARCLAVDPEARYPNCSALADDLRRHERALPLQGVRNRAGERWRKWRKRRPFVLPLLLLLGGLGVCAAIAGTQAYHGYEDRRHKIEAALLDGRDRQAQGQHEAAIRRYLEGIELAGDSPGHAEALAELQSRLRQSQRAQNAAELARLVTMLRFAALLDRAPPRYLWVLETAGRKVWAERDALLDDSNGPMHPADEATLRAELQEFALLWIELRLQLSPPAHVAVAKETARGTIREAESLFGTTLALQLARAALGEPVPAMKPASAAWEHCAAGRAALAAGKLPEARASFDAALALDPLGFVPNVHRGVCALREGNAPFAVTLLSFCAGLDPKAECFLLRGQAFAGCKETAAALADFGEAIRLNPELAAAYAERAKLLRSLNRPDDAAKDEARAKELGG